MSFDTSSFKAYDIRGTYPEQINAPFFEALGRAYAAEFKPVTIAIGRDSRLSGPELSNALARGLSQSGVDVIDLGMCGTEMVYYATASGDLDGGLMITASHNPKEYNGCKMVGKGALPVGPDSGLDAIRKRVAEGGPWLHARGQKSGYIGSVTQRDITAAYCDYVLGLAASEFRSGLRVVANVGNGAAGPALRELAGMVPFELIPIYDEPDGTFPNGVPNPLLPERRRDTAEAVTRHKADMGVAFDGDFDRCFFFDEKGRFIDGYFVVGLLAAQVLEKQPGATIVYDPRLTWNTVETVQAAGGRPVAGRTGHVFMKDLMRRENAVYGGEMSAHHYFRDFWFCDTGLLPFLLMASRLSETGQPLSALADEAMRRYPISGEINFTLKSADPHKVIDLVEEHYTKKPQGLRLSRPDGLTVEAASWRFNLRASNTEPLLRLNVEARADEALCKHIQDEVTELIMPFT